MTPTLFDDIDPVTKRKVRAWKVHDFKAKRKDGNGKESEYIVTGIVVSGTRLLEAEDSEIIAGGMNSKGDYAVALAREANMFSWGPPASPKYMTEEARRVFVNTIVYMKRFDGAKQTVWRAIRPRDLISQFLDKLASLRRNIQQEGISEKTKLARREGFLRQATYMKGLFPPGIVERFGDDEEKYRALYELNIGYIYVPHGTTWYTIDDDAKSIGIPNNEESFLEKSIELLNNPAEAAKAKRLLERYTRQSFPSAKAWQQWLDTNRDKLYFSDYYDYRFYTGPAAPASPQREVQMAIEEMKIEEPNEVTPVSVGAAAVGYIMEERPAAGQNAVYSTEKGALATLIVRLRIADGWHIYARVPEGEANDIMEINVELPAGARWRGDWQTPIVYEGAVPGSAEYRGDVVFTRQIYFTTVPKEGRDPGAVTKATLRGTVHYQTCNEERCLESTDLPFETKLIVRDR